MLTAKQIFVAIRAIDPDVCITLTDAGPLREDNWYVKSTLEVSDGYLIGSEPGFARTPEQALYNCWAEIIKAKNVLCKGVRYKWEDFMWRVIEKKESE